MTSTELAKKMGTTRASVIRAVRDGLIPKEAARWKGKRGGRRTLEIVDPELAMRSWVPRTGTPPTDEPAGQSVELGDDASAAEARRVREIYLARQAKLEHELATKQVVPIGVIKTDVATCSIQARTAFLQIGWKAMGKLNLSRDQAVEIGEIAREILTELAESTDRVIAKATKPGTGARS